LTPTQMRMRYLISCSLAIILLSGCKNSEKPVASGVTPKDTTASVVVPASAGSPLSALEGWSYDTTSDKMRGTTSHFASIYAKDLLVLPAPYDDGSLSKLMVRHKPGSGLAVMFSVSSGQISLPYNDEYIAVKFDDGPVQKWSVSEAAAGSSNLIFLNSEKKFVAKLKEAKKLMLEVPFYDAGKKVIEFDVAGLEWAY
jgi:hypothetical protein